MAPHLTLCPTNSVEAMARLLAASRIDLDDPVAAILVLIHNEFLARAVETHIDAAIDQAKLIRVRHAMGCAA